MLRRIFWLVLALSCILNSCATTNLAQPTWQGNVESSVFALTSYPVVGSGGGTGFAIRAASGTPYLITNAHVCEGIIKIRNGERALWVSGHGEPVKKKIIAISPMTDLCLVEGLPNIDSLRLAESFDIGENIAVTGHPDLGPLKTTTGIITGVGDVWFIDHEINYSSATPQCALPKQSTRVQERKTPQPTTYVACIVTIKDAIATTALARPGSSGSPMVNTYGEVAGVLFCIDNYNWSYMVPLKDLRNFLNSY